MGKKNKDRDLTKGEKSPALFAQPDPRSDKPDVWPLVIKDMADRDQLGKVKYGIPLRSHNGRDPLVDAYQEVLDLSVYLRQEIEERKDLREAVTVARRISGYENAGSNDIASLLEFLIDHIDQQKKQIQILSATEEQTMQQLLQLLKGLTAVQLALLTELNILESITIY